jgi:phosphopantothenoylcysteine decarboxylase/phosphopantothenate--cysteine ligase
MRILITSGGTKVPIDKVRHIGNMSSGTFGSQIAFELLKNGHEVDFLYAKGSKTPFTKQFDLNKDTPENFAEWYYHRKPYRARYYEYAYDTYENYASELNRFVEYRKHDIIVLAAAVSDYGVKNYVDGKIRSKNSLKIDLKKLPKLISKIKKQSKAKLVGFKLLVDVTEAELIEAANKSIEDNGCDMVIANDLKTIKNGSHEVHVVAKGYVPLKHVTDFSDPDYLARKVAWSIIQL